MKYLLVCSATLVAGISLADTNGVTPFDKLKLVAGITFSATAGSDPDTVNATIAPEDPTVEGGYYMLDGELTDETAALAMTATDKVDKTDIEQFTITYKAGFVDADDLPTYEGAKIGFALTGATTAKYYSGTSWVAFDALTAQVTEDAVVVLTIDFDGRLNQARFTLGDEVLKVSKSEWVAVGAVSANTIKAFGSGAVKSLAGLTRTITAEIVPITPQGETDNVKIEFTPDQITVLTDAGVDFSNPTELNTEQANGQTMLTNYILFGKAKDAEITAATMPKAVGEPKAKVAGNVAVKVSGLNVQSVEGAKVKYVLMGSETGVDKTWHQIGDAQTDATFEFPNTTNDRYFKVKAVIEYTTPANPANPTEE